ncbi:MAG TPA: VTT domain-containing protein [Chitinophagaceae bacterium]|nr:VTT domain-containing protein [Chitinophagaceae bacterium]
MITITITNILDSILLFLDAESLIRYGGLFIICLIVYANIGLFFCFFLPSGAVLFTAGVFAAAGDLPYNIFTVCSLLAMASGVGSITGYGFGRKAGPMLYKREDSKFFRRQYLISTEAFYKKHGVLTCIVSYFLPIIRSFAPVVAGMIRMNFRRFIFLTLIGSVLWIVSFVLAGWFIGSRLFLKPWLKYIVIGFILMVTVPLIIKIIKGIKNMRKE